MAKRTSKPTKTIPALKRTYTGRKGQPRFTATKEQRQQVEFMTAAGITQESMAALLGISDKTLARVFRKELATGQDKANILVARALWHQAVGRPATYDSRTGQLLTAEVKPVLPAQMFWLRTRGQWRDTKPVDGVAPPDDTPTQAEDSGVARLGRVIEQVAQRLATAIKAEES